jgi:1,4-alpha-glucan branching enzyme
MGQEFAQGTEWNFDTGLDWYVLDYAVHQGVQALVRDLNRLYRTLPALHARDCEPEGFRWINADDHDNSVYAWLRFAPEAAPVAVVSNFTPVPRPGYRIGLPHAGVWREVLNTDATQYGGSGMGNRSEVHAEPVPAHGLPASAEIVAPPLATVYFEWQPR